MAGPSPLKKLKVKQGEDDLRFGDVFTTSVFKLRKRRFDLDRLFCMPLEVSLEIFAHLHPLDLLHLARTCKRLRSILLNQKFAWVWRTARERLEGFPPCPEDLSEPRYANLAFDLHCHGCGRKGTRKVYWVFRVRLCCECMDTTTTIDNSFPAYYSGRRMTDMLSGFVDVKVLEDIFDNSADDGIHYTPFVNEVIQLVHSHRYNPISSPQQLIDLAAKTKKIKEHASICEKWVEQIKQTRAQLLNELRQQREDGIIELLRQSGDTIPLKHKWVRETFSKHHLMRQPKLVTVREWRKIREVVQKELSNVWKRFLDWTDQPDFKRVMGSVCPNIDIETLTIGDADCYEEFRRFLITNADVAALNHINPLT